MNNILNHDKALSEIDSVCCGERDEAESERLFEGGFNAVRIDSAEDFRRIMEAMEREAAEGGGMSWVSPDFDMEEIEKMFEHQENVATIVRTIVATK